MSRPRRLLLVALVAFVALALPHTAFGVAWPSVAAELGMSLGSLGLVVAVGTSGYFLTSMANGLIGDRFGAGPALAAASWTAVVALGGYVVATHPAVLLVSAFTLGLAGGVIDSSLNTHVALAHGPRAMGMLHTGFGAGSTLGPLVITVLLDSGASWRWGFAIIAALQAVAAVLLTFTAASWRTSERHPGNRTGRRAPAVSFSPIIGWTLTVFGLTTGVEVAAGQWTFTLLTESRGVPENIAGGAVAALFGGFTAARLWLGLRGHHIDADRVVRWAPVMVLASCAALWLAATTWIAVGAMVVLGLALGPIFPLQTLLTPQRVGATGTASMVGFQLGAATVGAAALPLLIGLLVDRIGLEVVGPVLAFAAAALVAATEMVRRSAAEPHTAATK